MKLFRYGKIGQEKPAVLTADGEKLDVTSFCKDYNEEFFATDGIVGLEQWLKSNREKCTKLPNEFRYGSAVARPSKIICVGLNYAKHARESGMEPPKEPVLFFKSTTALCGPNDDLVIPRNSSKTDWEVELAIVIQKRASYITQEGAMNYIAGYTVHNDYSEREFQLERGGQWVKGKSCDTFAPLGPYLVTKDEVSDPHNLKLWLEVNGERVQNSNTSDLIFNIPFLVSYISQFMTLLPGDVISTGTPEGVGLGFKPPRFLKAGDQVKLGIDLLGSQGQTCVALQQV